MVGEGKGGWGGGGIVGQHTSAVVVVLGGSTTPGRLNGLSWACSPTTTTTAWPLAAPPSPPTPTTGIGLGHGLQTSTPQSIRSFPASRLGNIITHHTGHNSLQLPVCIHHYTHHHTGTPRPGRSASVTVCQSPTITNKNCHCWVVCLSPICMVW